MPENVYLWLNLEDYSKIISSIEFLFILKRESFLKRCSINSFKLYTVIKRDISCKKSIEIRWGRLKGYSKSKDKKLVVWRRILNRFNG